MTCQYSGPSIYGPPHQWPPLLSGQELKARTVFTLNLPLTNGHPSDAASGHPFWVPNDPETPHQRPQYVMLSMWQFLAVHIFAFHKYSRPVGVERGWESVVTPRTKRVDLEVFRKAVGFRSHLEQRGTARRC